MRKISKEEAKNVKAGWWFCAPFGMFCFGS